MRRESKSPIDTSNIVWDDHMLSMYIFVLKLILK